MRRMHLFWVASWLAAGLTSCKTLEPPRQPQGLETAKACTEWRWVGISRLGARCPEIRGWTVRPLFPQLSPPSRSEDDYCAESSFKKEDYCAQRKKEKVPSSELIQELNRFCVYEIKDLKKGLEDLAFPPSASADLVKFDQDCAALTSTDRELDPKDWKADAKEFISPEPEAQLRIGDKANVRLAFLDTEPTREGVPGTSGRSQHGFTLMHLARQMLCAPGSTTHCAAQITSQLALPIVKFDPKTFKNNEIDPKRGGFMGMQSDLAQAIRDEVDVWRRSAQRHLVLNLSVAWDGNLFGGLSEEQIEQMRAGTQAVYYILQYAASFDVLVLAAAGNQKVEPCANFGPLLPAAWEQKVPKDGSCSRDSAKPPLLYAVGGVQRDGFPLANARPGGMPGRAAFGETPVLLSANPEMVYKEKIYSGSSVATAYASAIAAAVWSAFPDLDSHGVMVRLQNSGHPLGFNADFGFDANAQPVRLLSLCAALQLPCAAFNLSALPSPRMPGVEISSRGSCQPWLHPQPDDPPCVNPNCPPKRISN